MNARLPRPEIGLAVWLLLFAAAGPIFGATSAPEPVAIRAAIGKSLPLLERSAQISMKERKQCFTCHNQGLPILALTTAQTRGLSIDAENLKSQLKFTADFLAKNKTNYLQGKGQGGQAHTAGYALWTLENGG